MATAPRSEAATLPVRPGEEPWTGSELADVRETLETDAAGLRRDIGQGCGPVLQQPQCIVHPYHAGEQLRAGAHMVQEQPAQVFLAVVDVAGQITHAGLSVPREDAVQSCRDAQVLPTAAKQGEEDPIQRLDQRGNAARLDQRGFHRLREPNVQRIQTDGQIQQLLLSYL